jgi:hypothetical protein
MMAVPFPRKFARTTPTQYAYIEAPERGAGQGDGTVDTPRASAAETRLVLQQRRLVVETGRSSTLRAAGCERPLRLPGGGPV